MFPLTSANQGSKTRGFCICIIKAMLGFLSLCEKQVDGIYGEREYVYKHTSYKLIDMDKLPVLTMLSSFLMR